MLNHLMVSIIWGDQNTTMLDDCATVVDKVADNSVTIINEDATIVE